jgi:4-amino-4-deoxy-L-arabinose transferase-like glycosyltransferase
VKRKPGYVLVLLPLIVLALAVRLAVWVTYLPDTFVQPDTQSYLEPGMQLLADGSFPSFSRTPIYPLFLAVASKILSPNPAILALVQIVISIATMVLIYSLCFRLFGLRAALLAMLFMALDTTSAISANQLLSETLFTFLLTACLVGLVHFYHRDRSDRYGLIGISLIGIGFSVQALCRPVAFLLFVVVALWLYITLRKRRPHILSFVLCFCVFSILLPVSWVIRNHAHTGVYFFTTISSANIYEYRAAWNVSRASGRTFAATKSEFEQRAALEKTAGNLNEGELAKWKQSEGIRILKINPLLTLRQGIDGLIKMYLGISNASISNFSTRNKQYELQNADSLVNQVLDDSIGDSVPWWISGIKSWAIVYLLLLYVGVIYAIIEIVKGRFSSEQRHVLWLILIVIAYFTFFSAGAEAYSRFRVPIAPALSVLGAVGWAAFLNRIRPHKRIAEAGELPPQP